MRLLIFPTFFGLALFQLFFGQKVLANQEPVREEIFTEQERLQGYQAHQEKKKVLEMLRQQGAGEETQKNKKWEAQIQAAIPDYKKWKANQQPASDDTGPEYQQDFEKRKKRLKDYEEIQTEYVEKKKIRAQKKKSAVGLSEEEELGLLDPVERVDFRKRPLYGAQNPYVSGKAQFGGAGGSISSGSGDSAPPPPPTPTTDYGAPPPPPSGPDFYEPDMAPPPPPDPGIFDESVPPPIFDDPEF